MGLGLNNQSCLCRAWGAVTVHQNDDEHRNGCVPSEAQAFQKYTRIGRLTGGAIIVDTFAPENLSGEQSSESTGCTP